MPLRASRNAGGATTSHDDLVNAFADRVRRAPDATLAVALTGRVTVGDLDLAARQIAVAANLNALPAGSIIGLVAANGPAFLAGFLALRRTQSVVILLDRAAPKPDQARVLEALGAQGVLFCPGDAMACGIGARLERTAPAPRVIDAGDRAVIKLTSGSTGAPRGVAVSTAALLADETALASAMEFRADDRLLVTIPMSHSYGFTTLALSALVRGLSLVMPADDSPFAPLAAADRFGATVFPTAPAYLHALLQLAQPPAWPETLRLFISAGASLPPETAARFRESSGRSVHVLYGSSECGGICYDRAGDAGERGTVGTPVSGVSITLADAEGGSGSGVLTVRSAAVGETYLPQPDARLARGRFETADLARWSGDEIVLLGRIDRAINIRGFKVDPSEVESVIAALPAVREVVVTSAPASHGHGFALEAIVACAHDALDTAQVFAWCRARLADYKVPRNVILVDAVPRTPHGKIDQFAIGTLARRDSDVGDR